MGQILDVMAALDVIDRDPGSAARLRAAYRIFYGPLMRPLVFEEPIYDGLVNEMGYPHCSPVEARVTYTQRRPMWWREHWARWLR
ncbi:hypothetical protein [Mycobacterium sp. 1245801.1]|uniref:hypothetical protein n=1 Tax=Mycobacterium sp. 1245801.1 TaxID=1834075 RepID=UPI0012EA7843|nr:hypothetical protein [Mycobacterium sp. 1245801.1]